MKFVKINNIYFNTNKIIAITPFETVEEYGKLKGEIGYGLRFVIKGYESWVTTVLHTEEERNEILSNLGII